MCNLVCSTVCQVLNYGCCTVDRESYSVMFAQSISLAVSVSDSQTSLCTLTLLVCENSATMILDTRIRDR